MLSGCEEPGVLLGREIDKTSIGQSGSQKKMIHPFCSRNLLLRIYLSDVLVHIWKEVYTICIRLFTVALFLIVKDWKQPKCSFMVK